MVGSAMKNATPYAKLWATVSSSFETESANCAMTRMAMGTAYVHADAPAIIYERAIAMPGRATTANVGLRADAGPAMGRAPNRVATPILRATERGRARSVLRPKGASGFGLVQAAPRVFSVATDVDRVGRWGHWAAPQNAISKRCSAGSMPMAITC
jgi:hypothetical protein